MARSEHTVRFEVEARYDVLVVGGGPAGIGAAITAARQGARTALVERYGVLGGNLTVGHVGPLCGSVGTGTIADEISDLIRGREFVDGRRRAQDFELAKRRLPVLLRDAGVTVYLSTALFDVVGSSPRVALFASAAGPLALGASVFIDATGDGTLAYFAGAEWEYGREDGLVQPATIMFTIEGVDEATAICCGSEDEAQRIETPRGYYRAVCAEAARAGALPLNAEMVRLYRSSRDGERVVNASQANGVNALVPADRWAAEIELRDQIDMIIGFLRENVPGYERASLKSSADTLGIRESRRIVGDYRLDEADLLEGRRFEDAVVHDANFVIDIHNPSGSGQADGLAKKAKPYDIPYRSLLPRGVDGMILAGRCISGSHRAHASYRVMTIAMAMGQAAGTAAAIAAARGVAPRELPVRDVQESLGKQGVVLRDSSQAAPA